MWKLIIPSLSIAQHWESQRLRLSGDLIGDMFQTNVQWPVLLKVQNKYLYFVYIFLDIYLFSFCKGGNQAYGEIECPDAKESDQGAYSCEAINIKGFVYKYISYTFCQTEIVLKDSTAFFL